MIVALSHNCPELVEPLYNQVHDVNFVDVCSEIPVKDAWLRLTKNEMWVRNWAKVLTKIRLSPYPVKFVWAINDDVKGLSHEMYIELVKRAESLDAFMITPSFNSPHDIFRSKGSGTREVNWIDMCVPLINLEKYFDLGGFDLNFVGYFADIDLSVRAREKGYKMYVCDDMVIDHFGGYTTNKVKSEQSSMEYNEILVKKYGKSWNELI